MLKKSTFREIKYSLGRYLAILSIVALGVGFFAGLKVTREAMVTTTADYINQQNLFDFQLISTLGFQQEDVNSLAKEDGVLTAEGAVSTDVLYHIRGDESDSVMKFHSMTEALNRPVLKKGRLPEAANECVVDHSLLSDDDIGKTIVISSQNDSEKQDMFKYEEYVITGTVVSPYYLNFERGTTSLGNGTVAGFAYIPVKGFDTDYFTEIFLDTDADGMIYSDEYQTAIDEMEPEIKSAAESRSQLRYEDIIEEAEAELAEGQAEYDENYNSYLAEKADTQKKLEDAYEQIISGRKDIKTARKELQSQKTKLLEQKNSLQSASEELARQEADLLVQKETLISAREELDAAKIQLDNQRNEFEAGKEFMTPQEAAVQEQQLTAAEENLNQQLQTVNSGLTDITSGLSVIEANRRSITDGLERVHDGLLQIEEGQTELDKAEALLDENLQTYYESKAEADDAFAEADAEFADARLDLEEAKEDIRGIKPPDTYVLDRMTNISYACFESDSAIVDGIAKIFPVFFFMVAALVCMTTMTRMIDEQRTQIGILKALGYGNGAISAKYLFYSGSAALIGCIIGFFGGCYLFPKVIWIAYGMMYDFQSDIVYIFDPVLGLFCLLVALLCSMGATLVSCYADFGEVPAQLIRPKAPKDGKRIFLERIGFIWNHLNFLYKVSFRNIFRYKRRFFMMILGISGCTALLVAGFGINDSVKNVVNDQYDQIQLYDCSITFDKEMSQSRQERFAEKVHGDVEDMLFVYQGSADLVAGGKTKSVNLIASDSKDFDQYMDLHTEKGDPITFPKKGEAVICNNLADDYDIKIGDAITVRDEGMNEVQVTVTGIYQNFVYNYILVSSDTLPHYEEKTAYVHLKAEKNDNEAIHQAAANIMNDDRVVTVTVNNDLRNRVNNMMESLNYIIILVVVCAGALAFIVLYNLTNINITERIREIATIKVLGFFQNETSAYVFRENLFLTTIGAIVGLGLGKLLLTFIIDQIQIDLMCFNDQIAPLSYLLSLLLTFVFSALVSLAMNKKLDTISMTESLKSIE